MDSPACKAEFHAPDEPADAIPDELEKQAELQLLLKEIIGTGILWLTQPFTEDLQRFFLFNHATVKVNNTNI